MFIPGFKNINNLDEPTNFLDISTLKSLELFVKDYPGAILLVSHDQSFVKKYNE